MDHLVLARLPFVFTVEHLPSTVFQPWYHSAEHVAMPELLLNQCVQRSPASGSTTLTPFNFKYSHGIRITYVKHFRAVFLNLSYIRQLFAPIRHALCTP